MPRDAFHIAPPIRHRIIAVVASGVMCTDHYPGAAPSVGANLNRASPEAAAVLTSARDMFSFDDSDGEGTATSKRPVVGLLGAGKLDFNSSSRTA
jgi:hypothetical protein